jgi:hypothetical protein
MDPLNEPSISHPQTTGGRTAAGTQRVAPGGMYLSRHREQRPSHWAQDPRFWHDREGSLPAATRGHFPRLPHVEGVSTQATAGRHRAASLCPDLALPALRMVGVRLLGPLRMVEVSVAPPLRMMEVPGTSHLRMLGVIGTGAELASRC